jgi:hypothetical protein
VSVWFGLNPLKDVLSRESVSLCHGQGVCVECLALRKIGLFIGDAFHDVIVNIQLCFTVGLSAGVPEIGA